MTGWAASLVRLHPPGVWRRMGVLLVGNLLLLGLIFLLIKQGGSFASVVRRAGPDVAPVALAGLGMTAIIATGAIDLSIASIIALAGTVFGVLAVRGHPPLHCFAGCVMAAASASLLNGWLANRLRLPPLILTLAGLPIYRGLALILADVGVPSFSGSMAIVGEGHHAPGKMWAGFFLLAGGLAAVGWEFFGKTPRAWLALGNSEEGCRLLGLRPQGILLSAFGAGGLFLALAALVFVTQLQTIEPARLGLGFELSVIGAVVLGGTSIFGGEGSFLGTLLGAFFLYFVAQLLVYAEASPYIQDALAGAVILAVISLDCALHRKAKRLEELR